VDAAVVAVGVTSSNGGLQPASKRPIMMICRNFKMCSSPGANIYEAWNKFGYENPMS
jgi:hypothetical protein